MRYSLFVIRSTPSAPLNASRITRNDFYFLDIATRPVRVRS